MGTPIPPIPPTNYGEDCLSCFDIGETPLEITVILADIDACPFFSDFNGTYLLTQQSSCTWRADIGEFYIQWDADTGILFAGYDYYEVFSTWIPNPCAVEYSNSLTFCLGVAGINGTGSISWEA